MSTSQIGPASHPIAVVAARTGLSPDVLRVWERRYGAVQPSRSTGNQRLYSDEDIARFRLLAAATSRGRSIRSVATLPTEELERLVAEDEAHLPTGGVPDVIAADASAGMLDSALEHVRLLDAAGLDRLLRRVIARTGLLPFLERDLPALMHRIGDEWANGRLGVAHEHLASVTVMTIANEAIRALPVETTAPRLLVATLAGELHGVGSALAAVTAALEGWSIVNLGVDVPAEEITSAASAASVQAIGVSIVHDDDRAHVLRELGAVRAKLPPDCPLLVGGATSVALNASIVALGAQVCSTLSEFRTALRSESDRRGLLVS